MVTIKTKRDSFDKSGAQNKQTNAKNWPKML